MTSTSGRHAPSVLGARLVGGTIQVLASESLALPVDIAIAALLARSFGAAGYGVFALALSMVAAAEWVISALLTRATIKIVDPGFIPKLNNTVGITFGIDATNCQGCRAGYGWSLWTPVGINWSFFITDKFSAFADLGFNLRTEGFYHHVWPDFMFELGGRYHFNDHVALMFRVGYPFVTFGPTFFI